MKTLILTTGIALIALTGCASISEDQCLVGNWAELGYKDGANGKSRNALSDYAKTCAKYGALPNSEAYLNNYEQGLLNYCTFDRGFSRGERGDSYNQACSGSLGADFRPGYDEGKRIYQIRHKHENLIGNYEDTIRAIDDVRYRLDNDALSDDERLRLRKKLRRLNDREEDLRRDIRAHERRYDLRRYRLRR